MMDPKQIVELYEAGIITHIEVEIQIVSQMTPDNVEELWEFILDKSRLEDQALCGKYIRVFQMGSWLGRTKKGNPLEEQETAYNRGLEVLRDFLNKRA